MFDRTRTRCRIRRRRHFRRGGDCGRRGHGGGRRRVPDATSSPASDFLLKVDVVLGGKDARGAIDASDAVRGEPFGDGCFGALGAGGTICERASEWQKVRISLQGQEFQGWRRNSPPLQRVLRMRPDHTVAWLVGLYQEKKRRAKADAQDAHESSLVVTPGGSESFGFSLCLRAWLLL